LDPHGDTAVYEEMGLSTGAENRPEWFILAVISGTFNVFADAALPRFGYFENLLLVIFNLLLFQWFILRFGDTRITMGSIAIVLQQPAFNCPSITCLKKTLPTQKGEKIMSVYHIIEPLPQLTKRQFECLRYIAAYLMQHNDYPSQKQIAQAMGICSNTAYAFTEPLLKKGYLKKDTLMGRRNLRLTELSNRILNVNKEKEK